jgi:hypothetical protein
VNSRCTPSGGGTDATSDRVDARRVPHLVGERRVSEGEGAVVGGEEDVAVG